MYLLDTNIISEIRKIPLGKANASVEHWTMTKAPEDWFLSSIVLLELRQGALRSRHNGDITKANTLDKWIDEYVIKEFAGRILPVTEEVALACSPLHVPNQRDKHDALIGATALVHDLILVTDNTKHFKDIDNLRILNPFER
ncbi:type II toxin-antitoxin system VapC family toxin [Moraxella nonliquefaciens]|uniref:Type II toxin-antitoxin system VapC family toxin n=1 Tax=Moraxella nonliquefaciens TaxID=478 RepID=A0A1B8QHX8_MORNO|nr:type II toxin-antitoxin system VapC family toxin [Moraxella nonliquefaciens]OBX82970.1 hypothetical protein A7456_06070 [Moraxella nonliquefaciens]QPT43565.1 type II toxin-antitoxin system VapC family toxin [Moraxella nonliquefaciens]QPT43613.1 type II toxin-antitoxin system VapC family toxin [Moraxella nonliquefaciens]QQC28849.1 type II toxin-antitoxin system VapC family toxin [Moraxella nonliquefaciens]